MARTQTKLSNNKKRQLRMLVEQANLACASGRFDACEQLCRRIESMQPAHPDAANLRAIMCMHRGETESAIEWLRQAVDAAPQQSEYHINLGRLYLDQKRYAEAAECYDEAIRRGKKTLPVQLAYSKALVETGRLDQAISVLQALQKQHPHDTDVLMGLHFAHRSLNRIPEAWTCLEAVLKHDPQHAGALYELGVLDNEAGRLEQGAARLRASLASKPDNADAYLALAEVKRFESADDADIAAMADLYERSPPDSDDRLILSFMLGKAMDDLKQYDRAFAYFSEGNALRHKRSTYNADKEQAHFRKIMEAYTPEVLARTSEVADATPIFIIGMPRCGSTLTEQILASHPDVVSRGECDILESKALFAFHSDDDPLTLERLTAFSPEQWREVARIYLKHLRGDDSAAQRITDKTLSSIREVGAIHCALPNAKVVHVRRHPLDTCLSIYNRTFQGAQFDFGYDLSELGGYYRMYLELMQHWRDVLPAGAMYELDYERLVADQEGETRKLLEYCGLPWNEACLQFNKAKNLVRTASMAQVRRPIYTDSMAAWRLYEKHLQPLIDILGPEYSTAYRPGGH